MAARMQDIADLAKVSRPAVAAVLNGSKTTRVSPETRERILFYARQLRYRLNPLAHRLRMGCQERRIGIITDSTVLSPCSLLQQAAIDFLQDHECRCIVLPFLQLNDTLESAMDYLQEFSCTGALSFGCGLRRAPGILPRVGYELDCSGEAAIDKRTGMKLLVEHLISHGHRRIAYLTRFQSSQNPQQKERLAGYQDALQAAGIPPKAEWVYNCFWDDRFFSAFPAFLRREKITAVACFSDHLAARLISFLLRSGFRIPEDIAVTGFDGWSYTENTAVSLTTAVQPMIRTGEAMAQRILDKLDGKCSDPAPQIRLVPQLHFGHSCGCPENELPPYLEWESSAPMLDTHPTLKPYPCSPEAEAVQSAPQK